MTLPSWRPSQSHVVNEYGAGGPRGQPVLSPVPPVRARRPPPNSLVTTLLPVLVSFSFSISEMPAVAPCMQRMANLISRAAIPNFSLSLSLLLQLQHNGSEVK